MNSYIIILLSTYNGEKYLKEQLDSLLYQTYQKFKIIVRDDGSTDGTLEILNSYDLEIMPSSKNLGARDSFGTLLEYALQKYDTEYIMFCDQDDIWKKDKIEKTLSKMQEVKKVNPNTLILIHTDLEVVDENLNTINRSLMSYQGIDAKYDSLNYLIMQNNITGCTMMINRQLAELSLPIPKESIMHDWWIGLVASRFGKIAFLNEATIKYRQHCSNDTGAKDFSFQHKIQKTLELLFQNELYTKYLNRNIYQAKAFLDRYSDKLDDKTIDMIKDFIDIENRSFWQKRKILLKHKLLKQGFIRNIGLLFKI